MGMAHSVMCLLCNHGHLSSVPSVHLQSRPLWHTSVISVPGRQRQEDPYYLQTSQSDGVRQFH